MFEWFHHKETLEIRRQILHLILGLFLSFLISIGQFDVLFFSIILTIAILTSILSKFVDIPIITFFLEYFDRPKDVKEFPGRGFITFLIGSISSVLLFEVVFGLRIAALVAVLSLTIADSMSSLYGNMFGKFRNPLNLKKSVGGMVFAFLFLLFVLFMFLPWLQALLVSLVAVALETIEIEIRGKVMDDNIYIPLISGSLILVLSLL